MKQVLKIIYFACFVITTSLTAHEFEYPGYESHNISRSAPQLFLFNSKGELIYYSERFDPSFKKAFDEIIPYKNSEEIRNNIEGLLGISPAFEDYDFTLFFTSYSSTVGPCPPCVKQEKIINLLKKKFINKKISYNKIVLDQPHEYVSNKHDKNS